MGVLTPNELTHNECWQLEQRALAEVSSVLATSAVTATWAELAPKIWHVCRPLGVMSVIGRLDVASSGGLFVHESLTRSRYTLGQLERDGLGGASTIIEHVAFARVIGELGINPATGSLLTELLSRGAHMSHQSTRVLEQDERAERALVKEAFAEAKFRIRRESSASVLRKSGHRRVPSIQPMVEELYRILAPIYLTRADAPAAPLNDTARDRELARGSQGGKPVLYDGQLLQVIADLITGVWGGLIGRRSRADVARRVQLLFDSDPAFEEELSMIRRSKAEMRGPGSSGR